MRVLVIGGTGYLGPSVVRRLLAHGHTVQVFHRGATAADFSADVHHISGDRRRLHDFRHQLRELRPEVVVDVIAATRQHAQALIETFRGIARRTVILSSGDVYLANDVLSRKVAGPVQATPLEETAELRTHLYLFRRLPMPPSTWVDWNNYEKIDVEQTALSDASLPATILRLPMVYGPGDHEGTKRRFYAYLKRIDDARSFILLNETHAEWRAPWGYTDNVAEAIALAVGNDRAAGQIFNVCEPDRPTMRDLLEDLASVTGWSGEIVTTPQLCPPPDPSGQHNLNQHLDLNSTNIRAELGFRELIDRRGALAQTVAWERSHPPRQLDPLQFDYAAEDVMIAGLELPSARSAITPRRA